MFHSDIDIDFIVVCDTTTQIAGLGHLGRFIS